MGADRAAQQPADEAAKNGAGYVEAHDAGYQQRGPLFGDVGDGDDEDAWRDQALHQPPEGQHRQAGGGGGQQGGDGQGQHRGHDHWFAADPLGDHRQHGGRKSHPQGRRADGPTYFCFGGMEDTGQQRQQGLGAVQVEKGEHAAQERCEHLAVGLQAEVRCRRGGRLIHNAGGNGHSK